ncbi:hypothetical protein CONPUDRAFT_75670 [Coniophora puteana RWD-64-598 SS2]|uniref:WW domain-containing protein n=1 Tax=Coniophora puteana (strain RWD-64-598) TaxID=741705 RepID=A0A5M3MF62_CONPW|nr:uncharacterized protein CONPUDRAFT_75670 [Coniophora puteana RWD-64-598 SS2]EIW77909.1 hypothetical protein CONPUDRAFT_75670 [Coniophora puteana RWD-64-598 SS2]
MDESKEDAINLDLYAPASSLRSSQGRAQSPRSDTFQPLPVTESGAEGSRPPRLDHQKYPASASHGTPCDGIVQEALQLRSRYFKGPAIHSPKDMSSSADPDDGSTRSFNGVPRRRSSSLEAYLSKDRRPFRYNDQPVIPTGYPIAPNNDLSTVRFDIPYSNHRRVHGHAMSSWHSPSGFHPPGSDPVVPYVASHVLPQHLTSQYLPTSVITVPPSPFSQSSSASYDMYLQHGTSGDINTANQDRGPLIVTFKMSRLICWNPFLLVKLEDINGKSSRRIKRGKTDPLTHEDHERAGWFQKIHPEGAVYYLHKERRIFTDAPLAKLEYLCAAEEAFRVIEGMIDPAIHDLAIDTEMVLELTKVGEKEDDHLSFFHCGYYLVSHDTRSVFWPQDFMPIKISGNVKNVDQLSHLGHAMESEYWYAQMKTVTSDAPSLSPFNSEELSKIADFAHHAHDVHLKGLQVIWVDQLLNYIPWKKFVSKCRAEWTGYTLLSTVILNANIAFLALANVTPQPGTIQSYPQTAAQALSYASTVASFGSVVLGLVLPRRNHTGSRKAADHDSYLLTKVTGHDLGLEALAIVLSLPYGLLLWGMVFFIAAFAALTYQSTDILVKSVVSAVGGITVILVLSPVVMSRRLYYWIPRFGDSKPSSFGREIMKVQSRLDSTALSDPAAYLRRERGAISPYPRAKELVPVSLRSHRRPSTSLPPPPLQADAELRKAKRYIPPSISEPYVPSVPSSPSLEERQPPEAS